MAYSSEIAEAFASTEQCMDCITSARKLFGSTDTTEEQYDQMEKTLLLGVVHCPQEHIDVFNTTISEAAYRRYFFINIWN